MNGVACPDSDQLRAFALGTSGADADGIASHLDSCSKCAAEADGAVDGLLADVRIAAASARWTPERVRELEQLLAGTGLWLALEEMPAPVAGYELLEELGAGGFGKVYRARHTLLAREAAVKILHPQWCADPRVRARFVIEMATIGRLRPHPNVVVALHADEDAGRMFLVMELVKGQPLDQLLRERGPLPVEQACELAWQAANALQHIHEQGFVHRDVKPQNLMLTDGGVVKLLDLGLVRVVGTQGGTNSGAAMGTPDYMAPEQTRDARSVDTRADVYSLGCTLYHLLTGRVPFPDRHVLAKMMAHCIETPTPVAELRPDVPYSVAALVARAMAKEPNKRFQTPGAFAAALAPFCGHASASKPASVVKTPSKPMPLPLPNKPSRRQAIKWAAAGLVPIAAGAGLGWWWQHRKPGHSEEPLASGFLRVLNPDREAVRAVAFSKDGQKLARYDGHAVRVEDTANGQTLFRIELGDATTWSPGGLAFTGDGAVLVVALNDSPERSRIHWVNTTTGQAAAPLTLLASGVLSVAASGSRDIVIGENGGRLGLWAIGAQTPTRSTLQPAGVRAIASCNDTIASSADDGRMRVYPATLPPSPEAVWDGPVTAQPADLVAVGLNADAGRVVAVSRTEGSLLGWDVKRGQPFLALGLVAPDATLRAAAIASTSPRVVVGDSAGSVAVWDWQHSTTVVRYRDGAGPVALVAISADGRWAVTLHETDGQARLYRLPE